MVSLAIHYFLCRSPLCPKCLNDLTTVKNGLACLDQAGIVRRALLPEEVRKEREGEEKPREE